MPLPNIPSFRKLLQLSGNLDTNINQQDVPHLESGLAYSPSAKDKVPKVSNHLRAPHHLRFLGFQDVKNVKVK